MIFIAYNHEGTVVSIVNAIERKLADAFWQGAKTPVHHVESLSDRTPLRDLPTGVYEILKTTEVVFREGVHERRFIRVVK